MISSFAGIIEFQLVLKIKVSLGIVGDGQAHFVAHIANNAQVGVHVKIKPTVFTRPFRQGRVFNILSLVTGNNVYVSLGFDFYFSVAKNAVKEVFCKPSLGFSIFLLRPLRTLERFLK